MLKHARKVKQFTGVVNPFTRKKVKLTAMDLGDRIKQARKAAGFATQKALADAIGCKREAVTMWETGKVEKVGGEFLPALCRTLNVTPEWLQTGKGQKVPRNGTDQAQAADRAIALQYVVSAMLSITAQLRPEEAAAVLALVRSLPAEAQATLERGKADEILNAVDKVLRMRPAHRRSE